jgi:hypothetical protein
MIDRKNNTVALQVKDAREVEQLRVASDPPRPVHDASCNKPNNHGVSQYHAGGSQCTDGKDQKPMNTCAICGKAAEETITHRLVRDHDHATMRYRGLLCDLCNNWLGVYEKHLAGARKLRRKHVAWLERYREKIEQHLQSDLGPWQIELTIKPLKP